MMHCYILNIEAVDLKVSEDFSKVFPDYKSMDNGKFEPYGAWLTGFM